MNVFSKVFGTHSQREVKRIMPLVEKTEAPVSYTHLDVYKRQG